MLRILVRLTVLAFVVSVLVWFIWLKTNPRVIPVSPVSPVPKPEAQLQWNGHMFPEPVEGEFYQDDGVLLVEVNHSQEVKAMASGFVWEVTTNKVDITGDQGSFIYQGLVTTISNGAKVTAGQVIGKLEVGHPDPRKAKLRVRLEYDGKIPVPDLPVRHTR